MEEYNDVVGRALKLSLLSTASPDALRDEVEQVLAFVAEVQSVEGESTPVSVRENVFREDTVTVAPGTYTEVALALAPQHYKSWFLSKKIL